VPTKAVPAKFARHLAQPPTEFLEQKLPLLRTTQQELTELSPLIVCALRRVAQVHPKYAKPKLIDIVSHTRIVTPRDLGELKELMGSPFHAFEQRPAGDLALPVLEPRALAKLPEKITISRLKLEDKTTFFEASHALLHGPVDSRVLGRPGYKQTVAAMLQAAKNLPVLVAPDLVVCDGDAVDFSGYAALYFNNVIVEGSGRIILGNNTKLHAYQVKRV